MLEIRMPVVIFKGDKLIVTATLDASPRDDSDRAFKVLDAVEKFMREGKAELPDDEVDKAIFYAILYGGLLLIYSGRRTVPLSRLLPSFKLSLRPCEDYSPSEIADKEILDLWSLLASGEEREFLSEVSKRCIVYPQGYRLVEGNIEVSPVGVVQKEGDRG